MVTGDEQDADAGGVALRDRLGHLGAWRIEHRDCAEEAE